MAGCVDGLIDAQGVSISFRESGATTWELSEEVTDLPMPDSTKPVDDITPVDSTHKKKATAGAIDSGALALELLQISGSDQQAKLRHYHIIGKCLEWKIDLNDEAKTTYEFCAPISKFTPVRAADKKNRLQMQLEISGEVVVKENDVVVVVPPVTP
ncbi:phage tail tube protein [Acinetobacter pittii]|uniref:phage tail tube protein n=1 Tax=Acinetobacter pittii TaxID=48296 RepID=UPI001EECD4BC|nr:phage tail tube protein [Acinetobacter pittii]